MAAVIITSVDIINANTIINYHNFLTRPHYYGSGLTFSGAVHVNRPYGAPNIFHTDGSVVGVGVVILDSQSFI